MTAAEIPDEVWIVERPFRGKRLALWLPERWLAEALATATGGQVKEARRGDGDMFGVIG